MPSPVSVRVRVCVYCITCAPVSSGAVPPLPPSSSSFSSPLFVVVAVAGRGRRRIRAFAVSRCRRHRRRCLPVRFWRRRYTVPGSTHGRGRRAFISDGHRCTAAPVLDAAAAAQNDADPSRPQPVGEFTGPSLSPLLRLPGLFTDPALWVPVPPYPSREHNGVSWAYTGRGYSTYNLLFWIGYVCWLSGRQSRTFLAVRFSIFGRYGLSSYSLSLYRVTCLFSQIFIHLFRYSSLFCSIY